MRIWARISSRSISITSPWQSGASVGNRRGEAMTMSFLGKRLLDLGQADKALDIESQTLTAWHDAQESRGEALALALSAGPTQGSVSRKRLFHICLRP